MSSTHTPGSTPEDPVPATRKPPASASVTPIGVDVGRHNLVTLAPADAGAAVDECHAVDGARVDRYYAHLRAGRDPDGVVADQLRQLVEAAAHEAVSYALSFYRPVVVLETLDHLPGCSLEETLSYGSQGADAVDYWLYPALQERLTDAATAAGIPAVRVDEKYTTKQCHYCDRFATVRNTVIECDAPDCPVGEVCRDRSAAVSIAKRAELKVE